MFDKDSIRRELQGLSTARFETEPPKAGFDPPGRVVAISKDGRWAQVILQAEEKCANCAKKLHKRSRSIFRNDGRIYCRNCAPSKESRYTLTEYGRQRKNGYRGVAAKNAKK